MAPLTNSGYWEKMTVNCFPSRASEVNFNRNTEKEGQPKISGPVAFRPDLTMVLALYRRRFKLPTGKLRLIGAGHIQFEVFSHWVTPWIEVKGLVRIAAVHETIKNAFCQEKNGFPSISLR